MKLKNSHGTRGGGGKEVDEKLPKRTIAKRNSLPMPDRNVAEFSRIKNSNEDKYFFGGAVMLTQR